MSSIAARMVDLASDVMLTSAHVTDVVHLSPDVVKVELTSPEFRKARWTPGAKLQFRPARGDLRLRTYTPTRWDNTDGTTELIALTHDHGPGGRWFAQVDAGQTCEVFGPRRSVDLTELTTAVFVGDESSIGLACALDAVTGSSAAGASARCPRGNPRVHRRRESAAVRTDLPCPASALARARRVVIPSFR